LLVAFAARLTPDNETATLAAAIVIKIS
jgi:hypothetical protein